MACCNSRRTIRPEAAVTFVIGKFHKSVDACASYPHNSAPDDAPVAQLDRVPGYEPGGREFESLRARQLRTRRSGVRISPGAPLHRTAGFACCFFSSRRRHLHRAPLRQRRPGAPFTRPAQTTPAADRRTDAPELPAADGSGQRRLRSPRKSACTGTVPRRTGNAHWRILARRHGTPPSCRSGVSHQDYAACLRHCSPDRSPASRDDP